MDESEDTISVMSTGGNRALSTEIPVCAERYNNQGFGTFWLTKDGFPGAK